MSAKCFETSYKGRAMIGDYENLNYCRLLAKSENMF